MLHLIDAPVSSFSRPESIKAWIKELKDMEPSISVKEALDEAEDWLEKAKSGQAQSN